MCKAYCVTFMFINFNARDFFPTKEKNWSIMFSFTTARLIPLQEYSTEHILYRYISLCADIKDQWTSVLECPLLRQFSLSYKYYIILKFLFKIDKHTGHQQLFDSAKRQIKIVKMMLHLRLWNGPMIEANLKRKWK